MAYFYGGSEILAGVSVAARMIRWCGERAARFTIWTGLKMGCLAAKILPPAWLYWASDRLADLVFFFARDFRIRSERNVSLALSTKLDKFEVRETVRASLRHFFRDFIDIVVGLAGSPEQLRSAVPIIGSEYLDAALVRGRGAVVISAHLGNFILLGVRLALEGYTVNVLVNLPRNGQFARLMSEYRAQARHETIYARPRRDAFRALSQALRRNEVVVVIADEHRRGSGIEVPFFGRTVLARRGPATLALRTGAAVVPAYLVRNDKGVLRLMIEPELELIRSTKSSAGIRENVISMTRWLEKTVRAYPNQWNWMNVHWHDASKQLTKTDTRMAKVAESRQP